MRFRFEICILAVASILLFARLGHYPLWDDEASTALCAKGILQTGDTSAIFDHNIFAYQSGAELRDFKVRYLPPLQSLIVVPFIWIGGTDSAFWVRVPFALCGLLTIALILFWLRQAKAARTVRILMGLSLITSASFLLFSRQARYYSPVILCSTALAYLYLNYRPGRKHALSVGMLLLCLLGLNYLSYLAMVACLAIDYALWRRHELKLGFRDFALMALPQIFPGILIPLIWNPLTQNIAAPATGNWLVEKIVLFGRLLLGMSRCEFGAGVLALLLPFLLPFKGSPWVRRAAVATVGYLVVITAISPPLPRDWAEPVRYLIAVLPLCLLLTVRVITELGRKQRWLVPVLAVLALGTNVFNGVPSLQASGILFYRELVHPVREPYSAAIGWLKEYVRPLESVWVVPYYMTSPLLYHAPHAQYAWQYDPPSRQRFPQLAPIHVHGEVWPRYILAFGPQGLREIDAVRDAARDDGAAYELTRRFDVFWLAGYRPELTRHLFKEKTDFDRESDAVYAFRLAKCEHSARCP